MRDGREQACLEKSYTAPPTSSTFTCTYALQIPAGTTIRVRGECSIAREIREDLIISEGLATTGTISTSTITLPATVTMITAVITIQTTAGMVTPTGTQSPSTTQTSGFSVLAAFLALAAAGVTVLWGR